VFVFQTDVQDLVARNIFTPEGCSLSLPGQLSRGDGTGLAPLICSGNGQTRFRRRAGHEVTAALLAVVLASPLGVPSSPAWIQISTGDLRAGYDDLWAVSDVHGRLPEFEALLLAAGLCAREGDTVHWVRGKRRQLLIVVGDLIDGGPDGRGVVRLVQTLQAQAAEAGSRVVVLIGNHDFAYLRRHFRGRNELSVYFRTLPIAAFVGSWFFAHSGYLDAGETEAELSAWFQELERQWASTDPRLLGSNSILCDHTWWKHPRERAKMVAHLRELGLNGVVFGHDPHALSAPRTIAIDAGGRLIKLDTGLKTLESRGMMLRCRIEGIARPTKLSMMSHGEPTCRALWPDGSLHPLPVEQRR
jgi:hypothetical protein